MFGVERFLLIASVVGRVLSRDTDYCYAYNKNPYLKFGKTTAYQFVHGGKSPYQPIPHCKPIQIWMLIRHGAAGYLRPNKIEAFKSLAKFRNEIIDNHEKRGYGRLCSADLENLRKWSLFGNGNPEIAEKILERSVQDLNLLGKRIRSNFPELFPPTIGNISSENYMFGSSLERRTMEGKKHFMSGLLNRTDIPDADIPFEDNPFTVTEDCPRWQTEVARNPKALRELTKFKERLEYQNLISNITRRLGFQQNISYDSIILMWRMCGQDKAWKINELSPWCAVFSEEELKVLEYLHDDLWKYHFIGSGHDFNRRLGCRPMRNLFQHFQKLESDNYLNEPKGVFHVARSVTLDLFTTAMGFLDETKPPLASNFQFANQRKWRTSERSSYAANIAAVFYKCESVESPNKVMFYTSEKPASYEGCDNGLCDWEYLKNKFPNATSECSLDFCYPDSSANQFTKTINNN